jgi:hypothetical protein
MCIYRCVHTYIWGIVNYYIWTYIPKDRQGWDEGSRHCWWTGVEKHSSLSGEQRQVHKGSRIET